MEILDVLIFVQGLIWGLLLFKRASWTASIPVLLLFTIGLNFFMVYAVKVYGAEIPASLFFTAYILIFLLMDIYLINKLVLSIQFRKIFIYSNSLISLSLVLLFYFFPGNRLFGAEEFAGSFGVIVMLFNLVLISKRIRKRVHTGNIMDIKNYGISIQLLLLGFVYSLFLIFSAGIIDVISDKSDILMGLFEGMLAILLFITGYSFVQLSFIRKESTAKIYSRHHEEGSGEMVIRLMEEQKPYLDSELSLADVADMLDLNEYELTRVLHTEMKTSFYALINHYRVETVKRVLLQPDSRKFTIMAAAYESGFNSRSTFYRIFKEHTGMQPGQYVRKNK